jgi:hypothetical protein
MAERSTVFYGELRNETPKCWIVFDGVDTVFIPKSQARVSMIDNRNAKIVIPEWLAKKKGVI